MKRKRRIEITRYRRRITVLEGCDAAVTATLPLANDIIADELDIIPPAEYRAGEATASGAQTCGTTRRRPANKLRDLLRLRR